MDNSLHLTPGKDYTVIKQFIDHDSIVHEIGETWTYQGTNFVPYDEGLTLHVVINNEPIVYRLQWTKEAQATIIENFKKYVEQTNN